MKKLDLGQTISILANIGVIAGIVFLGIEVRQNHVSLNEANAINRASSSATALEYLNEFRASLAQDEQLAEIWLRGSSGSELSSVEQVRFFNLCETLLWAIVASHRRFTALGQEREAEAIVGLARGSFRDPGMRECWDANRMALINRGDEALVSEVERTSSTTNE